MDDEEWKRLYSSLLEQQNRIETRAFTTLGNFLTANAFVFVAWANFYKLDSSGFGGIDWVLTLLAIAGYVWGLAWALLGARNWEYARRIVGELIIVGGEYRPGRESLYSTMRGVEDAIHESWKGKLKLGALSYHATILAGTPLVVSLLYVAMLTTLLCVRQASPFGCAPWFLPTATVTIGLVLVGIVNVRCSGSIEAAQKAVEDARKQFPAKAA